MTRIDKFGLQVDSQLVDFTESQALLGTDILGSQYCSNKNQAGLRRHSFKV